MRYNPALDAVRALAIGLVLLTHSGLAFPGGRYGVDVFFVLSGFLITRLLTAEIDRTGRVNIRQFYYRRFLRLAPQLVLLVAFCWLVFDSPGVIAALLYMTDVLRLIGTLPSELGHTWSLGVEEKFYLLWPVTIMAVHRARRPESILLCLWLLVTLVRFLCMRHGLDFHEIRLNALLQSSGLIAGAWAAYCCKPNSRAWLPGMVLLAVGAWPFGHQDGWALVHGMPFVEIGTVCLIASAIHFSRSPRAVAYFGRISYGTYLWHWPVYKTMLFDPADYSWWQVLLVGGALSVAVAAAMDWCVDRPIRSWRRRTITERRSDPSEPALPTG